MQGIIFTIKKHSTKNFFLNFLYKTRKTFYPKIYAKKVFKTKLIKYV